MKHKKTIELRRITPELAEQLLEKNYKGQRHIKPGKVNQFASLIARGKWNAYLGDLVRVTRDGHLIDGQHRMSAIVKIGMAADVLYCEEFDMEDFPFIDAGTARTASDALGGVKNSNNVAATIRLIILSGIYGFLAVINNDVPRAVNPGNAEVARFYEENPWVVEIVNDGRRVRSHVGAGSEAAYSFFIYMITPQCEEKAKDFIEQLESDYCTDVTFANFKKRMLSDKSNGKRLNAIETLQMLAVAWNAFYEGRELTKLYPRKIKEIRGWGKA